MEVVNRHWRASPTREENGSSDHVRNQEKTITIKEDISHECMSFNKLDVQGNEFSSKINGEDTKHSQSNGSPPASCQERRVMLKLSNLLNMLKVRYKEICVVIVVLLSLITAYNNG